MKYDFNWGMLIEEPYLEWILDGIWTTVHLALVSWIIALIVGILIGTSRVTKSKWLRLIGAIYVEVFRGVPQLVQLFLWFFVFPMLMSEEWMLWWNGLDNVPYFTAVIAISLFTAARVAEQIRSGIAAIPRGQFNAALSTGLTPLQMYRYVIIPYAIRVVIPAIGSEFLTVFKNTALALTVGIAETTYTARSIETDSFHGIEAYSVASLTYMGTTTVVVVFMGWVERRTHIPGLITRR
jgi:glutamate/aspartate transport system permease protein